MSTKRRARLHCATYHALIRAYERGYSSLCGVVPRGPSSERQGRQPLNRGGSRDANCAR